MGDSCQRNQGTSRQRGPWSKRLPRRPESPLCFAICPLVPGYGYQLAHTGMAVTDVAQDANFGSRFSQNINQPKNGEFSAMPSEELSVDDGSECAFARGRHTIVQGRRYVRCYTKGSMSN